MNKKKKEKMPLVGWQKIFVICSLVFVIVCVGVYGGRLLYYMDYFKKLNVSRSYSALTTVLKDNIDLLEEENGLFENEDGSYTYRNQPTDNYCMIGSTMYRILGITVDEKVRLVSEKPVSVATLYEEQSFEQTDLYDWLNISADLPYSGVYENMLGSFSGKLVTSDVCYVTISDLNNIDCSLSAQTEDKVTVLSIHDYFDAGGQDSFLNCGEDFWLCNQNENGLYYYVDSNGSLGQQTSKQTILGVRPVVTLNYTVTALSGFGTIDDPYILDDFTASKIGETLAGDYVQYGDYLFRVNADEEDGITMIMEGVVCDENGEPVKMAFGSSNVFSSENGIGKYLNTTFLSTLPDYQEKLVEHDYNYGLIGELNNYSYINSYQNAYHCYVGIPNLSYLFLNEVDGYYISMQSHSKENLIFVVHEQRLYADFISESNAMRPVICMLKSVAIVSGNGTADSPYVIE